MPPLTDGISLPVIGESTFQWMSLEERARGAAAPSGEFPPAAEPGAGDVDRRRFLQIASAAAAMVGLGGCFRQPEEKLLPYSSRPAELRPGLPLHHATGLTLAGLTTGLVVTSNEGRPTKVEGNPLHPGSLGATGPIEQASLLDLYDPSRARAIRQRGRDSARTTFDAKLKALGRRADEGEGLRFLVEPTASPLIGRLLAQILERFPRARFVPFAPAESQTESLGAELAFGRKLRAVPRLAQARVVVSLEADFLAIRPDTLRLARDFVDARDARSMNRLYVAESGYTLTGAYADNRLRVRPREVLPLGQALATQLGIELGSAAEGPTPQHFRWAEAIARDLKAHRGESAVLVGAQQHPSLHALGFVINEALGNLGTTLELHEPLLHPQAGTLSFEALTDEMRAGRVDTLVITAWNPAFAAPAGTGFAQALSQVENTIYVGLREDETATRCTWFAPATHPFETWGDGRGVDGTISILQPLIAPIFKASINPAEVLAAFATDERDLHRMVKAASNPPGDEQWEQWLADGVIPDSASTPISATVRPEAVSAALASMPPSRPGLELRFTIDAKIYDGRFAQNAWLQELPDPITQLTWGNAALVSPQTARRLKLESGRWARLVYRGRTLEAPVLVLPGHAEDTVSLSLGYGGAYGVNGYALRTADAPWGGGGLEITPMDRKADFALAQLHWRMEGRELALQKPVDEFHPEQLEHLRERQATPYRPVELKGHQWGMAIDLHRCIGCSACVVACQAENNIPAVGKDQVRQGREMHWLRIDRYFSGTEEDPTAITQPVACVHCETAPCEYVCPVNATVHSDEGLNQMIYNRCIGTRYCSNNCPYKVRRFNYFNYTEAGPVEQLRRNTNVTVRGRGVMEKCTYCVQRIETVRIGARIEERAIKDAEIRTACQQACPTRAIVFGDLSDAHSEVARLHEDGRAYELLHELATRPRTRHLLRLKNPNPELG